MKDILEELNDEYNNYCEDLSIREKEIKLMIDLGEGTDYSELSTIDLDFSGKDFYIMSEEEFEENER